MKYAGWRADQPLGVEDGFVVEHEVNGAGQFDGDYGIGFEFVAAHLVFQPLSQRANDLVIALGRAVPAAQCAFGAKRLWGQGSALPAEHAFGADGEVVAIGRHELEEEVEVVVLNVGLPGRSPPRWKEAWPAFAWLWRGSLGSALPLRAKTDVNELFALAIHEVRLRRGYAGTGRRTSGERADRFRS